MIAAAGLLAAGMGVGTFSCKKENKNASKDDFYYPDLTTDERIKLYDDIGKSHNDGVDYVYHYLIDNSNSETTLPEFRLLAKEGTFKYVSSLGVRPTPEFEKSMVKLNEFMDGAIKSGDIDSYSDNYLKQFDFTSNQLKYIDSLEFIFANFAKHQDLKIFNDDIDKLRISAINILEDSEEPPILSYASVSRASAAYWTTNGDKWVDNINGLSKTTTWKDVAKADGVGAQVGFFTYGVWGLIWGPATWAGTAAAVITGAVGKSVEKILE
jgi:hypothetical protein